MFMVLLGVAEVRAQDVLSEYQQLAATNNPGLKSLYKQYEAAMQRVPQVSSLPDPTVGFGYFITPVETRVGPQLATISASQSFPWFGQLNAQEQAAEERARVVLEQFNEARSKVNYEVSAAYHDLYMLNTAIRLTKKNLQLLSSFKQLAEVKFESGEGSLVDVLKSEIEIEEMNNRLRVLEDSMEPQLLKMAALLNMSALPEIAFPEVIERDTLIISKSVVLDSIRMANSSLKALEHRLLALDYDIQASKKQGAPSFTIGLNYSVIGDREGYTGNDNGKDAFLLPSVGLKLPLYRAKYQSNTREKELRREAVQWDRKETENHLYTKAASAFRDHDDAVRRITMYQKLVGYGAQALDIMMAEYASAEKDFEDLLEMDRQLLNYELELETARADKNVAVAYINYLVGVN